MLSSSVGKQREEILVFVWRSQRIRGSKCNESSRRPRGNSSCVNGSDGIRIARCQHSAHRHTGGCQRWPERISCAGKGRGRFGGSVNSSHGKSRGLAGDGSKGPETYRATLQPGQAKRSSHRDLSVFVEAGVVFLAASSTSLPSMSRNTYLLLAKLLGWPLP